MAKLLRQGRVRSGERVWRRGELLAGGERLEIQAREGPRPDPLPNRKLRLTLLHEEPELVGVAKPAGLAMHPGPGHGSDTLLNALVGRFPELLELGRERGYGLVHRLDRDTSGVLLVARSARAYEGLVEAFRAREVEKEYWALVAGQPPEAGEVDLEVADREALTRYARVDTAPGPPAVSLVHAWPVTGRTHQVRIHLASLGCPVLGDARHGAGRDALTARLYLPRLALHARRIACAHPLGGERLALSWRPPKDWRRAWTRAQRLFGAADRQLHDVDPSSGAP